MGAQHGRIEEWRVSIPFRTRPALSRPQHIWRETLHEASCRWRGPDLSGKAGRVSYPTVTYRDGPEFT
jgi:hypothetical protein